MTGCDTYDGNKANILENSDPGRILNLVMSLTDDCCSSLQTKLNAYLVDECEAELVFHVVLQPARGEGYVEAVGKYLLCRKRRIYMTPEIMNKLSAANHMDLFYNLDPEIINITKPYFPNATVKTRVVLQAVPGSQFSVLVCVVAPIVQQDYVYTIIKECYKFVFPLILKSIKLEYESSLKENCQTLLKVIRKLFVKVSSQPTLLKVAIKQARKITKAEHCALFLIDVEKMELIQKYPDDDDPESDLLEKCHPMDIGLVGETINTGFLINARNATEHPNYDPQIDSLPGMDCRSTLLFPIRDQSGIVGVCQLINKVDDPYFDVLDEEIALAFSVYCGICVVHSRLYHKLEESVIRNALANELILYHVQVTDEEVSKLLNCEGFHSHPDFTKLDFNQRALPARELPCYVMKMFEDLGFDKKFNIKRHKLARFVLQVRKGYRDVPGRGFQHGFSASQWAHALMMNCRLVENGYLTDLQAMMCIIACLVHCLDHRGTTYGFQINGKTSLAALYTSEGSVLERHHLAQALCILNSGGCGVLDGLSRGEYDRALLMLKDYVIATDLGVYLKKFNEYHTIAADFQKCHRVHITALQAMIMVAADLSDSLKDWGSLKRTFAAMISEYFSQGDMEKIRGELPEWATDQDRFSIPDLAIQFLTEVCAPVYQILGQMIPEMESCDPVLENHVMRWEAAKPIFSEVPPTGALAILLSPELDELIDKNIENMLHPEQSEDQLRTSGTQSTLRSKAMLTSAQRLQSQQSRKASQSQPALPQSRMTIEASKKQLQRSQAQVEGSKPQMQPSKPQVRISESQEEEGETKVQPSQAQIQASQPQVQGSQPQVQASQPQVQTSQTQVQPSQAQVQASQLQVQGSQLQVQGSQTQIQASQPQVQASQPEEQASQAQVQPSQAQVQASQPQLQPSQPEVQQSKPQVRISVTQQEQAPQTEVQASQPQIEASKPQVEEEVPASQPQEVESQQPMRASITKETGSQQEIARRKSTASQPRISQTQEAGEKLQETPAELPKEPGSQPQVTGSKPQVTGSPPQGAGSQARLSESAQARPPSQAQVRTSLTADAGSKAEVTEPQD